jgi:hypothetical protein
MKKLASLWETLAMIASGVLIWAWFIARERSRITPNAELWPGWTWLQYGALLVLFIILVRRMLRIRNEFKKQAESRNFPGKF